MTTRSEELFERLCTQERWICRRIRNQSGSKSPDYELQADGERLIVEVKQLDANPTDRRIQRELGSRGHAVWVPQVGKRIRSKIQKGRKQLKTWNRMALPTLLLFYDNSPHGENPIDELDFRTAMYGKQEMVALYDRTSKKMSMAGSTLGGGRAMSETTNTSIGALGSIYDLSEAIVGLNIYHNCFASTRLPLLRGRDVHHFALASDRAASVPVWQEIK